MKTKHNLRIDRGLRRTAFENKSKNYIQDTIQKKVMYNLRDLSTILVKAKKKKLKEIYLTTNLLPLISDKTYGYSLEKYKNILRGIGIQMRTYKINPIFVVKNKEDINNLKLILKYFSVENSLILVNGKAS